MVVVGAEAAEVAVAVDFGSKQTLCPGNFERGFADQ